MTALGRAGIQKRFGFECSSVQEEPEQHQRIVKVRVDVKDANRRALIQLADVRDLQEQMREITERLGSSVVKIGDEHLGDKPNGNRGKKRANPPSES